MIFKQIINFFKNLKNRIFIRYLSYLQTQKVKRGKIIINIKSHFSDNLNEINYKTITPPKKIEFNKREKEFLNILRESVPKKDLDIYLRWSTCPQPKDIPKLRNQREIFKCILKGAKFIGQSGGIIYKKQLLVESAFNIHRFKNIRMIDSIFLKHRKMKGAYTSIMHYFLDANYYHFLIDNVPRLYAISKIDEKEIYFIIPKGISRYQLEILNIFLDDRFRIIPIGLNEVWKVENFYFSSFCSSNCSGFMPKIYLDFVKNKMKGVYGIKTNKKDLRIYISRSKDRWRHIINENQIYNILTKYGFTIIHPRDESIKNQIKLFNSAEIIISSFGSGLSNLIFSDNCKVLELFPPYEVKSHFFMLSKALGLDYYYLKGYKQYNNNNFKIDLLEFEEIVKEMIKK